MTKTANARWPGLLLLVLVALSSLSATRAHVAGSVAHLRLSHAGTLLEHPAWALGPSSRAGAPLGEVRAAMAGRREFILARLHASEAGRLGENATALDIYLVILVFCFFFLF
jgi:hypothetical protein